MSTFPGQPEERTGPARGVVVDLATLRLPAAMMLAAGVVLPRLPQHPYLACPLRTLTGIPCPACGMTTSVEATLRLDLSEAWAAAPMGILAVVVALAAVLVRRRVRVELPLWVVVATLAAMWVFQLHRSALL